jgi:hypothetical protein
VLASDPEDPLLSDNISRYIALEQDVSNVRSFEPTLVHGLLQTKNYAQAVLHDRSTADPDATDRLVELRMRRQDRLYVNDDPLTIHVILDEAVLHRLIGGEQVMRPQLERLLDDAQRPNITIQILPFSIGAHPATEGPFGILTFPGSDDYDLVYVEGHLGDLYLEKEHDVHTCEEMFDRLVDLCLTSGQSTTLISKFLLDHERKGRKAQ